MRPASPGIRHFLALFAMMGIHPTTATPSTATETAGVFRLEARVLELSPDGTEREATRVATEVAVDDRSSFFVWWGRHDGRGGPLTPEAGSELGEAPHLGESAWQVVWHIQSGVRDHGDHREVLLNLGKARFDGMGDNGRPVYRRNVEKTGFFPAQGKPKRLTLIEFDYDEAKKLGVFRVILELRAEPIADAED